MAAPTDPSFTSNRGGLNKTDPPHLIPPDQVTDVENVEFFESTLGERRRGTTAITIDGSDSGLFTEPA